jgi:Protein of unknown function (DUF3667)
MALEFFQHPLLDTKLWKTLVPLVLRPGLLTEEFLAGRRTRYVRPLKLFLTVSITFFAVTALLLPSIAVRDKLRAPPVQVESDPRRAKARAQAQATRLSLPGVSIGRAGW